VASCKNPYLKTGIELSVLQLPKAATEEEIVAPLQSCKKKKLSNKRFERLAERKEVIA
jgi:hypothetical protein